MTTIPFRRSRFLVSCGSAALAAALLLSPQQAKAQAFQADFSPTPSVSIIRTPGADQITVLDPTAIIDWTPFATGGEIFLPDGNTATFQSTSPSGTFAVLNRIFGPIGDPVVFNGEVISATGRYFDGCDHAGWVCRLLCPFRYSRGIDREF